MPVEKSKDVESLMRENAEESAPPHRRTAWLLWALVVWVSASGAHCPQVLQQYTQPIPRALPPSATLDQIINVVNDNSARVQSFSSNRATISIPGLPSVNSNITFQRPRSFRLTASSIMGQEFDLGSNDELLWFWVRRAQPPALFYCRHEQFATSAARQIIPLEPEQLIEAFGVVYIDRSGPIEGPSPVGSGRVQLKLWPPAPGKGLSRILIIDDSRGVVLQEHLYDPQGMRVASATMSKHVRDQASATTLPHHVDLDWPAAKFEMSIDMPEVQVNQLSADPRDLFTKPSYSGYNEIDLGQPVGLAPPPTAGGPYRAAPGVRY